MRIITKGATDQSVSLYIVDNTTGLPVTSLAYNSSGVDLWYRREGAAVTSITEATQTASGAHSDGGFVHLANGVYRLDLPDAAVASGVDSVTVGGTFTGYNVYPVTIQLVAVNPQSATAFITGVNSLAPPTNWNLASIDSNGRVDVIKIAGTTQTARDIGTSVLLSSGTGTGQISLSSGLVTLAGVTHTGAVIPTVTTTTTATNLTNAPTSGDLTATMKASVKTQVVDALNTDTYAQPGQESPPATTTLGYMIRYIYKAWRNKKDQSATLYQLYADDATTVDQKATVGESGGTTTVGEIATGP